MFYNKDLLTLYADSGIAKYLKEINRPRISSLLDGQNISKGEYDELVQSFFFLMPFCNITSRDHTITFENCCTDFIKQIFKDEVDENTFVISTQYEHPSVKEELKNCKNVLTLNYDNLFRKQDILSTIIKKAKNYKKVFVYIIGTQTFTGQITPQQFLVDLKETFIKNKIIHKIALDDVHGMFMYPRDYSIFDYILYTAHAIIPNYNMGMLISKNGKYGKKSFNAGAEYIIILNELLQHKKELTYFKNIMTECFYDFLKYPCCNLFTYTVNHIFALALTNLEFEKTDFDILDEYGIVIPEHKAYEGFLRIRFQEFLLQDKEKMVEGLVLAKRILKKAISLAQLKGNIQ